MPTIIGSETASIIRSRECRERKKQLALGQEALQCSTNETGYNNLKQICRVDESTKTNAGTRKLPMMTEDVVECFQGIIEDREPPRFEKVIADIEDCNPLVAMH